MKLKKTLALGKLLNVPYCHPILRTELTEKGRWKESEISIATGAHTEHTLSILVC